MSFREEITNLLVFVNSLDKNEDDINIERHLSEGCSFSKVPILTLGSLAVVYLLFPDSIAGFPNVDKKGCHLFDTPIRNNEKKQEDILNDICEQMCVVSSNIKTQISYIMGELIDNIHEHSLSSKCFVGYTVNSARNRLYMCFADNGQTIPGSYVSDRLQRYTAEIAGDESKALRYSIQGRSTKERGTVNRGYGLSTSIELVTKQLEGSIAILTSNILFVESDNSVSEIFNMPEGYSVDGTLILVEIPLKELAWETLYKLFEH